MLKSSYGAHTAGVRSFYSTGWGNIAVLVHYVGYYYGSILHDIIQLQLVQLGTYQIKSLKY